MKYRVIDVNLEAREVCVIGILADGTEEEFFRREPLEILLAERQAYLIEF